MADGLEAGSSRRARRWRTVSEKLEIVQLTLKPGASVAEVARAHGVNANQVFKWRREFERGELNEPCAALIPVTVASTGDEHRETEEVPAPVGGVINIELPGRALISAENGADPVLLRTILESLRK
jgi:transposase